VVELRRQHVRVARAFGQDVSEEALGRAAAVDVCRVDEVDADLEGPVDAGLGLLAGDAARVRQPRAEADLRDLEVARAEAAVVYPARLATWR